MKAIALWEPWASLMAHGFKKYETRHWFTREHGEILVFATKTKKPEGREAFYSPLIRQALGSVGYKEFDDLPFSCLLSVHDLRDCVPSEAASVGIAGLHPENFERGEDFTQALAAAQLELVCGNYSAGRFAFHMPVIKRFSQPIPFVYPLKGPSKFFRVPLTPQIYKNYTAEDRMKYQLKLKEKDAQHV